MILGATGPGRAAAAGYALCVDGHPTALVARRAATFWARARGLLGAGATARAAALEIRPCAGVHTFGMAVAVDVAFVDGDGRVQRLVRRLRPWRMAWHAGAVAAWELPCGSAERLGLRCGSVLELVPAHGRRPDRRPVPDPPVTGDVET